MKRLIAGALALTAACASPTLINGSDAGDAAMPTSSWPTNGGDYFNRRYSPLDEINRQNVAELRAVWRARLDGSGVGPQYSGEAQPVIADGVLYIITGANDVFAIDVATGERIWAYTANLDPEIDVICCGWTSRGVALGAGRVYVGQLDGKLVALEQETGEIVWSVQAERWQDGYTITSAPLYYDGLVITGFAGAEYATRGRVKAYDAQTGVHVWTWYATPAPGEPGSETWPAESFVWRSGGGTVWQTPALDPDLGLIYFTTGNAGPDFNGAVRPGDNLYTSSVVALDVRTGEHRWHFQMVHHDIWDYDMPTPVVLFNADFAGHPRRGLAATGKTGWLYILDRETGEPLLPIEERPVPQEPRQATAATQPYPEGDAYVPQEVTIGPEGFELINQGRIFTPFYGQAGVPVAPSQKGGANWPPSSYDPQTNRYFVCATSDIAVFRGGDIDHDEPASGDRYLGGRFGSADLPSIGVFAALDVTTNRLVWNQAWPDRCYSGSVATAGGLVFVGRSDGRLTALDSADGTLLWEFQTGAGMNAPASVFEYEGRQYVAAYSAGNLFAGSERGDSVWLFSLDGTIGPATEENEEDASDAALVREPRPDATSHTAVLADDSELARGAAVYATACQFCHGEDGRGGNAGVAIGAALGESQIRAKVASGGTQMPSFAGQLSDDEIDSVSAYLVRDLLLIQ
ncbi:MAG: PQQ-binding-like beta-propeller repeat protein [Maricaulaceae bacterium]|jgi:alcohol dehydrogenase (cytochrome c)